MRASAILQYRKDPRFVKRGTYCQGAHELIDPALWSDSGAELDTRSVPYFAR